MLSRLESTRKLKAVVDQVVVGAPALPRPLQTIGSYEAKTSAATSEHPAISSKEAFAHRVNARTMPADRAKKVAVVDRISVPRACARSIS